MATTAKTVTYEEWLTMPVVEDATEEVVNGEIRIMPPNKWIHGEVVENLADLLKSQVDRKTVLVRITNFGLVIRREPLACRVPDLAVFRKDSIVEEDGYIHSAPQLVIEVLSPANTRAGREEKIRDYESLGVPEVWVVSPEARTVEVLLLEEGKFRTASLLNQGQLRPTHFPEAALDIPSIWPK